MKVSIISLGCPRNLVDSEKALGILNNNDFLITEEVKKGLDFLIINTCGFIKDAKEESIDYIIKACELKKDSYIKHIIICGCLVQRYSYQLKSEFPEIDAFLGVNFPSEIYNTIRLILNNSKSTESKTVLKVKPPKGWWDGEYNRFQLTPSHYTYLKVNEGCQHNCSFCIIPKIKGRLESQKMETLVNSIKKMCKANKNLSEINLVGQDISLYGIDIYQKPKLHELVEKISKIDNIKWIRLLYLHPNGLYPELLETIANNPKVCKYIDVPIQHINRNILRKMARKTEPEMIKALIENLRKKFPNLNLRTTVMVGFPGETDEDFKELLSFIKEVKFDKLGCFTYSREEGTASYNFKPQLSEKIKQKRWNQVMQVQQDISMEKMRNFFGKVVEVIIDRQQENEVFVGRTQFDAPEVDCQVFIRNSKRLVAGDYVKVKIEDTYDYDLVGRVVN